MQTNVYLEKDMLALEGCLTDITSLKIKNEQ